MSEKLPPKVRKRMYQLLREMGAKLPPELEAVADGETED